ncbi:hypothetical protein AXG93_651s1010 [Marchantia polymorpha subsp. ruderalis]|uniref:Uncharacterized protein n=1 Tax=Marchantia polymorpha subsp. ruderalis TaxID=1480154 RepID=A0A176WRN8_MARPO|nr:hypothetical protein AXG93_651s1010 [Marchantia polymorpha subsp. ruderalis]
MLTGVAIPPNAFKGKYWVCQRHGFGWGRCSTGSWGLINSCVALVSVISPVHCELGVYSLVISMSKWGPEEFTEFLVCYNIFNTATAEYEVDGTIDVMTRISVSPSPSYVGNVPEFYNDEYEVDGTIDAMTRIFVSPAPSYDSGGLQEADEPKALQPLSFALYPYAKLSTYTLSLNPFFLVGLTSAVGRAFDTPVCNCLWKQRGKDVNTTNAEMIYIKYDENPTPSVPSIVNCTFPTAVAEDGNGGVLKLAVNIQSTGTVTADVFYESKGAVWSFNDTLEIF